MAIPEKPRLIYSAQVRRGRLFRRFLLLVLLVAAVIGAYAAFELAANRVAGAASTFGVAAARVVVTWSLLDVGKLVAIVLIFLLSVRGLYYLIRALTVRNETVRFYDQGFIWVRGHLSFKYAWHELETYRDSTFGLYFFRWPILQGGALILKMNDGPVFRYNGRFGDTRPCARAIRRYAAYVNGIQMANELREGRSVTLGRKLVIYPAGVDTGKVVVPWSALDVRKTNNFLTIRQKSGKGWQTVGRYSTRSLKNVGGFLELAGETIQIHQPARRKTKAPPAEADAEKA